MRKGISIVVCCHNSVNRIKKTITHLSRLKQPKNFEIEVILVDNASTDKTAQYSNDIWNSVNSPFSFKVINESCPGLSYARKAGVLNAQYSIVVFCDDDNWLDENYLIHSVSIMENPEIGIAFGKIDPVYESEPPSWFFDFEEALAIGLKNGKRGIINPPKVPWGAGMVLKTEFLKNLWTESFDSKLSDRKGKELSSGGDSEICYVYRKAGYKWWYEPSMRLKHFIPKNRVNFNYLKKLYSGFGRAEAFIKKYYTSDSIPYENKESLSYIEIFSNFLKSQMPWISKRHRLNYLRRSSFMLALVKDKSNNRN